MQTYTYSEFEKLIESVIKNWVKGNNIPDYDDEDSTFNYVDALTIASEITTEIYLNQDGDGLKITPDAS